MSRTITVPTEAIINLKRGGGWEVVEEKTVTGEMTEGLLRAILSLRGTTPEALVEAITESAVKAA